MTIEEIVDSLAVGGRRWVQAKDLGLTAEQFHQLATDWIAGDTDGFIVVGTPHRESESSRKLIDIVQIQRTS